MENTIKVLLVNNGFPNGRNLNHSTYIKSIYECLLDAGLFVDLVVLDVNEATKLSKLISYLKLYFKLLFGVDYRDYDYIYIHHFPHVFLPIILHLNKMKNLVINWHGNDVCQISLLNQLAFFFIPSFSKHIVPSNYFKGKLISKIKKISENCVYVSPSGGVDLKQFYPAWSEKNQQVIFGYASGLDESKGILEIIELAKIFSLHKFYVINYGKEKVKLQNVLQGIDNIELIKPMQKGLMPEFYNSIDILLFPTKREAESLGLVSIESMACGVPVVGPDEYALSEIIVSGISGEKYAQGDFVDLVNNVKTCLSKLELYRPEVIAEKYSKTKVTEQLKRIFQKQV